MTIGLGHYLAVAAILFTLGIFGIFLNRKNVIIILMSIELILLAVNINLVAFSAYLGAIVFLPLLGAFFAGLIALAGARARYPGKGPVAGAENTTADHGPHHGEAAVEGGGVIQPSRYEEETHEPAAAGSRTAELITTTL